MDREQLAWAAGFFDGEGYVGTVQVSPTRARIVLVVVQACDVLEEPPEVLVHLHAALGFGRLRFRPVSKSRSPNARPQWEYVCTSLEHVQAVMAMLWPWLGSRKRDQFHGAIMAKRHRQRSAWNLDRRKLTDEQVQDIRRRYRPGNGMELCEEFGISRTLLGYIIAKRRNYADV